MASILQPLNLIRGRLNEYLKASIPRPDDWVILSNIVNNNGNVHEEAKDKVVMFLANLHQDTTISTFNRNVPISGNQYAIVTPPLYINLYLLFYANFQDKNYPQALELISEVISYFQQNPVFTHETLPELDASITRLTLEFSNLDATALSHLMTTAGTKYLPSAYYKVRMIPFQANAMQGQTPAVQGHKTPEDIKQ
jgi:hypothetical protein